jgi:hypothetical protein
MWHLCGAHKPIKMRQPGKRHILCNGANIEFQSLDHHLEVQICEKITNNLNRRGLPEWWTSRLWQRIVNSWYLYNKLGECSRVATGVTHYIYRSYKFNSPLKK